MTPQNSSRAGPSTPSTKTKISPSLTSKLSSSVGKASSTLARFQSCQISSPSTEKPNADDETGYTHEKLEWLTEEKIRLASVKISVLYHSQSTVFENRWKTVEFLLEFNRILSFLVLCL